jgi:uncharacterized protein (UPF0276 family)
MIHLAINYSPQAAQLMTESLIDFHYFKCPDWPDKVADALKLKPVAVHFTLIAGNDSLVKMDWTPVESLLSITGTPYVNLHLGAEPKNFPTISIEETDTQVIQPVVARMLQDVMVAVKHFGAERVIIENVPYRASGGDFLRACVEPDVINHIVEETGCGLLLDISHARITAHHMNIDELAYMQVLPVHRLKELHFTGVHTIDGKLQDHLSILPQDWLVLDWALANIQQGVWPYPWLVSYEYGGLGKWFEKRSDIKVIAEQMPILYERIVRLE